MKKIYCIPIFLKKDFEIYEEFNPYLLSSSLDEYILKEISICPISSEIILQVHDIDKTIDQEMFINTIHEYYDNYVQYYKRMDFLEDVKRFVMLFLGIIFIVLSYNFRSIIAEIFSIAGWVALWEMFYDLLFEELERRNHIKRFTMLANAKIEFLNSFGDTL